MNQVEGQTQYESELEALIVERVHKIVDGDFDPFGSFSFDSTKRRNNKLNEASKIAVNELTHASLFLLHVINGSQEIYLDYERAAGELMEFTFDIKEVYTLDNLETEYEDLPQNIEYSIQTLNHYFADLIEFDSSSISPRTLMNILWHSYDRYVMAKALKGKDYADLEDILYDHYINFIEYLPRHRYFNEKSCLSSRIMSKIGFDEIEMYHGRKHGFTPQESKVASTLGKLYNNYCNKNNVDPGLAIWLAREFASIAPYICLKHKVALKDFKAMANYIHLVNTLQLSLDEVDARGEPGYERLLLESDDRDEQEYNEVFFQEIYKYLVMLLSSSRNEYRNRAISFILRHGLIMRFSYENMQSMSAVVDLDSYNSFFYESIEQLVNYEVQLAQRENQNENNNQGFNRTYELIADVLDLSSQTIRDHTSKVSKVLKGKIIEARINLEKI